MDTDICLFLFIFIYIFFFAFLCAYIYLRGPIGARPRVRPLGSPPPHASLSYEDLLSLPVPTSTKIYTIRRSTCQIFLGHT